MKRKSIKWIVIGLVGLLGGVAMLLSAVYIVADNDISSGSVIAGEPQTFEWPAKAHLDIQQKAVAPISSCEVRDPSGTPLDMKPMGGSTNDAGWQLVYRFTTIDAGTYTVQCTAKTEGRQAIIFPTSGMTVAMRTPLGMAGIAIGILGIIALMVFGAANNKNLKNAQEQNAAMMPPMAGPYQQPMQQPGYQAQGPYMQQPPYMSQGPYMQQPGQYPAQGQPYPQQGQYPQQGGQYPQGQPYPQQGQYPPQGQYPSQGL